MSAVLTARPEKASINRYAQIVASSKKGEWEIDRDLIQGRGHIFDDQLALEALVRFSGE